MYLSRIYIDPRCREGRRDLSDPYQLHSTLCRAFSGPDKKCPGGEFLWRLEPETDSDGHPRLLVQSRTIPDWTGIGVKGWLLKADPAIDLEGGLKLDALKIGRRFRFRLRANPCVTRNGKRLGLMQQKEQLTWIGRKGEQHGFSLSLNGIPAQPKPIIEKFSVQISQGQMLRGNQHKGNPVRIFSVLYDGILSVIDPDKFMIALQNGIGHGKVMGLGLLSAIPIS